jgi:AcrR family transcriptional regulator
VAAAEFGAEGAGAGRLPRGRHGLPREVIVENQRQRLIVATVAAVAEHGYNATTVSSIVKSAGLSRATFYELFKGKEACFLAAYEATLANLREATLAGAEKAEDWAERIRAGLGALLAALAADPDRARLVLIAPATVGDRAVDRHHRAISGLLAELIAGPPRPPGSLQPSEAQEQSLAGALSGLIVRKIQAGQGPRLSELLPTLTELILRPYLGDERAIRLARAERNAGQ